jgi:hypothetical protein
MQTDLRELTSDLSAPVSALTPVPLVSPSTSHQESEFPPNEDALVDGIISYLTRKHGGNVHDLGIVNITSKSVVDNDPKHAVRTVALLNTHNTCFCSKDEPGKWVCWDFQRMRIRPTHYTLRGGLLASWSVESSMDGTAWAEIDWRPNYDDFWTSPDIGTFRVSTEVPCRFIRLTQTAPNRRGSNHLSFWSLEVFGTLLERNE